MDNLYQVLGVPKTATQGEIKARYYFLVKAYHPDRYTNTDEKRQAEEELKKVNQAYEILGDEDKRKNYDFSNDDQVAGNKSTQSRASVNYSKKQDEGNDLIEYLNSIFSKWGKILHKVDVSSFNNSIEMLILEYANEILKISKSQNFAANKDTISRINEQIRQATLVGFVLGLESASNNQILKYGKDVLIKLSAQVLFDTIYRYIGNLPVAEQNNKQIDVLLEKFVLACIALVSQAFNFGEKYYFEELLSKKQETINETPNYQGTPKNSKSNKLWGAMIALLVIGLGILLIMDISGSFDPKKNKPSISSTPTSIPVINTSSLPIIYSTDFSSNDGEWEIMEDPGDKFDFINGQYRISTVKNTCTWASTYRRFANGIVKAVLVSDNDAPINETYTIDWRSDLYDGYYGIFIWHDGFFKVYKQVEDDIVELFSSTDPIISFEKSLVPIYISFIGPEITIIYEDRIIASITDSSLTTGSVGLGICTDEDYDGSVAFDSLVVYSPDE